MEIIGHRGYPAKYPENTILSFKKAIECGADGIEMDVHLSSDGKPFIFHDFSLERLTDRRGMIYDTPSNELKRTRLKGSGQTVPSLEDVLEELGKARIFLELKTVDDKGKFYYPTLAEKVSKIIGEYNLYREITVISFDPFVLERVRGLDRRITIGLDYERESHNLFKKESLRNYAERISLDYFIPEWSLLMDSGFVKEEMPVNGEIYVWTVNDGSKINSFIKKPRGIITDRCCDIVNELEH